VPVQAVDLTGPQPHLHAELDKSPPLRAADASKARDKAEAAFDTSAARAEELEQARDKAVAACGAPDRIPLSGETVTLGGLRLILSRELDDVELLMAGQTARLICGATGITEEIETDVRKALAAEEEAEKRRRPLLRDRDGTVWPNPLNPDLPSAAPQGRPAPPRTVQESRILPAPPRAGGFLG
jgi:hypothetical protein